MLTYLQKAANTAGHVTRTYATSAQLKIFDNSKHAAFLAAAGSVESLPIIETHPPEVSVHHLCSSFTVYNVLKIVVTGEQYFLPKSMSLRSLSLGLREGRANVGKSTLLNAVLGRKDLVHTSKKAVRGIHFALSHFTSLDGHLGGCRDEPKL